MIRLDTAETIVAVSSPQGDSVRSIVRISGPNSWRIAQRIFRPLPAEKPGTAVALAVSATTGEPDPAVIPARLQFWPNGRSYTGQESIELHLDVPNVLAESFLHRCVRAGARAAEPGEFSLRAFLLGRMDLTRAEAVAEIFQATTPDRMHVALDQLAGGLGSGIEKLRNRLLDLSAWLEATLDFVEESDVDPISRNVVAQEIRGSAWELARLCEVETARDNPVHSRRIVIVGKPNAGKSRLFNALSGSAGKALVSPVAGTTRDYLEARIDLGIGTPVTLVDTAGEGEHSDTIDGLAQALGKRERILADLFLVCVPCDASATELSELDVSLPANIPRLFVRTKADLVDPESRKPLRQGEIPLSAATGVGLDTLESAMCGILHGLDSEAGAVVAGTRIRAGDSLRRAREALERAATTMASAGGDELVAIDLRSAVESLDVVTGRDATEETLDRIFSRFCIGK